jgi:F420-dependent methylenetetrahydromethanopterin dehydrogenase
MGITTRKTNALRNSQKAFTIAQKIADAACELDFLRKAADQAVASEAEKHINILHRCAAELADDRACDIYEQVNELKVNLRYKRSR